MSGWLSLAITVILLVVVTIALNRTITVRTSRQSALDEIKREVGAIITELNATTERNIQLIEDKARTLEALVAQADRRLGALRRDLSSREAESATYSHLKRPGATEHPGAVHDAELSSPADGHPPRSEDESTHGVDANRDRRPSPFAGTPPGVAESRQALRARVRGLYLQGVSLERIASIVGKTVGEVELIVSLDEGAER